MIENGLNRFLGPKNYGIGTKSLNLTPIGKKLARPYLGLGGNWQSSLLSWLWRCVHHFPACHPTFFWSQVYIEDNPTGCCRVNEMYTRSYPAPGLKQTNILKCRAILSLSDRKIKNWKMLTRPVAIAAGAKLQIQDLTAGIDSEGSADWGNLSRVVGCRLRRS